LGTGFGIGTVELSVLFHPHSLNSSDSSHLVEQWPKFDLQPESRDLDTQLEGREKGRKGQTNRKVDVMSFIGNLAGTRPRTMILEIESMREKGKGPREYRLHHCNKGRKEATKR